MKTLEHIRDFLDPLIEWAMAQADIQAVALVGSYARAAARNDSDIDLVILTTQSEKYFGSIRWVEQFGEIEKYQIENYGELTSLRVWYQNRYEVEYGLTTPDWAAEPLDAGTRQVIADGMLVLYERSLLLSPFIR